MPERGADRLGDDPVPAYRASNASLQAAFAGHGVLERSYLGPLGSATGAERLQIRLYDLLAHGWDLAQATGIPARLPEDLAEQALAFVQLQLSAQSRTGRFAEPQPVEETAPAIDRLAAFLGRPVPPGHAAPPGVDQVQAVPLTVKPDGAVSLLVQVPWRPNEVLPPGLIAAL
jgi:uncharacterized protein (TIGR03086 family)